MTPPFSAKPLLMISHCAADGLTRTLDARTAIEAQTDYKVLVDRSVIEGGDQWRDVVYSMLAKCHTGVVFIGRNGLESEWVKKEVTIFRWRRALDPGFQLRIFLLDGVTVPQLRQGSWSALGVDVFQIVEVPTGSDLGAFVASRLPPGGAEPKRTPLDELAQQIATILDNDVGRPALSAAAQQKGLPDEWHPGRGSRLTQQIAEDILRRGIPGLIDWLKVIGEYTTRRDWMRGLVDRVAPFWVPGDAAANLRAIFQREPRCAAVVNGKRLKEFSSKHLARRSMWPHLNAKDIKTLNLDLPNDLRAEVEIQNRLYRELQGAKRSLGTVDDVRDFLAGMTEPSYCVVLPKDTDDVVVEAIGRYPLLMLINAGVTLQTYQPPPLSDRIDVVQPELNASAETAAWSAHQQAMDLYEGE